MIHKSNLGSLGNRIPSDMEGYIPEATDGPWDFAIDHGCEDTHDDDGELTEYGEWWENDGFPDWQSRAIAATEECQSAIADWRENN